MLLYYINIDLHIVNSQNYSPEEIITVPNKYSFPITITIIPYYNYSSIKGSLTIVDIVKVYALCINLNM